MSDAGRVRPARQAMSGGGKGRVAAAGMIAAVALSLGLAGPSAAAPSDAPAPTRARSIDVQVEGRVTTACSLPELDDVNLGDLGQGNRGLVMDFSLSCNLPFELQVQSSGGLAHSETPQGQGGFSGSLDYSLDISLGVRDAKSSRRIERQLSSINLIGGATLSSGDDISTGEGSITLVLGAPEGHGLLAGAYSSTITLTLTPGF